MPKKATKKDIEFIKEFFKKNYDSAKTELNYSNDYELLIAIILSAQCTDKRVNILTPALFKKYPDIRSLSFASLDEVKELIKTCSFFNTKAKNIINMAKTVCEKYNGIIPNDIKLLIKLSGVGNKTAKVFMIESTGANLMAVDTHVYRVAHRLGLAQGKTVEDVEKQLVKNLKNDLDVFHQAMVLFGRYICKAVSPLCDKCQLKPVCKSKGRFAVGS